MASPHQIFQFPLNISYQEFLPYYRGEVNQVEVVDTKGRTLWINARHFRPFLSSMGIKAYFKMVVDSQGNLISLSKC
ncbi:MULTISPECIES: DUF2835 domain-containing protein [unclassified Shewanella]|uniref:DUF2835 domain-containing protein n=1 Tax=unclassified Shewanella TaxID=196818 RepID=UPI001BBB04C7|nr:MULTISPECIES: DUF2835 domain-containing protein [unclassified Shewanella]GIU07409.1 hypothetical protein TUM4444_06780 [Shewanella sp. MBTL60-112-B1]GIU39608.1 hypothetical protein TUM4445_36510 [Shewanella sp. MBTL60-112-B2]